MSLGLTSVWLCAAAPVQAQQMCPAGFEAVFTEITGVGDAGGTGLAALLPLAQPGAPIAVGPTHVLGVSVDGSIVAKGDDSFGQLKVPPGISAPSHLAAGEGHSVAIVKGALYAWGNPEFGISKAPDVGGVAAVDVAAGKRFTVALLENGTVVAWGISQAIKVPAGLKEVAAIAAGDEHAVALLKDGTVVTWGDGSLDQLKQPADLVGVTKVVAAGAVSIALKGDGTLALWGSPLSPVLYPPDPMPPVVDVVAAGEYAVALHEGGSLTAWGAGDVAAELSGLASPSDLWSVQAGPKAAVLTSASCLDIDECALGTPPCVVGWVCNNTPGSYTCDCPAGLGPVPGGLPGECADIDECTAIPQGPCGPNTVCTNLHGSFDCTCLPGYAGDATLGCVDVDECLFDLGLCPKYEVCVNTPGGYDCLCQAGTARQPPFVRHWPASAPAAPAGLTVGDLVAYDAAGDYGLAALSDGSVVEWGAPSVALTPPALTNALDVAATQLARFALLSDGTIEYWSAAGPHTAPAALIPPASLPGDIVDIEGGSEWVVARRANGAVITWGQGAVPVVPAGLTGVTQISASLQHVVALKSDGTVVAFGDNARGQTTVPAGLGNVTQVSAGHTHSVALKSDGTITGWGQFMPSIPVNYPTAFTDVVKVEGAAQGTYVLTADGTLSFAGYGLNTGLPPTHYTGVKDVISVGLSVYALFHDGCVDIDECATGTHQCSPDATCTDTVPGYTCACNAGYSGNGYSCVDDDECQEGTATCLAPGQVCLNTPGGYDCPCAPGFAQTLPLAEVYDPYNNSSAPPAGLSFGQIRDMDVASYVLAALDDGTAVTWGPGASQAPVPAGLTQVISVAATLGTRFALQGDGTVVSWVASGQTSAQLLPPAWLPKDLVQIDGGLTWVAGRRSNGELLTWGESGVPLVPPGLTGVVAMSAGNQHVLAIKSDGTVVGFGLDVWGQSTPPAGLANVVQVAAGHWHSVALKSDGTVVAWGRNIYGETNVPAGLTNVIQIAAAGSRNAALKADGTIVYWGFQNGFNPPVASIGGVTGLILSPENLYLFKADTCDDVDECADGTAVCDPNATCANTPGSYTCTCNPGYAGDGVTCTDIDECADGTATCLPSQVCTNTPGSFTCTCLPGQTFSPTSFVVNDTGLSTYDPPDMGPVVSLAGSDDFVLARMQDGTVQGWGSNHVGQLNIPVGLTGVVAIAAGADFGMALRAGNQLVTWGAAPMGAQTGVTYIAASGTQALTIGAGGAVAGYGPNTFGQNYVPATATGATDIATSGDHALAVAAGGAVVAWGRNDVGQATVPANLGPAVAVGAGRLTSAAVLADGTVVGWGQDPGGLFAWLASLAGASDIDMQRDGVVVSLQSGGWVAWDPILGAQTYPDAVQAVVVDAGPIYLAPPGCHDIDECANGTAFCDVDATCVNTPGSYTCTCQTGYAGNGVQCVDIDECALRIHRCVGGAFCNNLPGGYECLCPPGYQPLSLGAVTTCIDVDECAAGTHDCGPHEVCVNTEGSFLCECAPGYQPGGKTLTVWGDDGDGALQPPAGLKGRGVRKLAAGADHIAALMDDGTLVAWGANDRGQAEVPAAGGPWRDIAAGDGYTLALNKQGEVVVFGATGDLGPIPVDIGSGDGVFAVRSGDSFALALRADGTVIAWGASGAGQTSVPPKLSGVVDVATGPDHAVALKHDGTVQGWGSVGAAPSELHGVVAVAASDAEGFALADDGTLWRWSQGGKPIAASAVAGGATGVSLVGSATGVFLLQNGVFAGDGQPAAPGELGVVLTAAVGGGFGVAAVAAPACVDIDECADGTARCPNTATTCVNLEGSYTCLSATGCDPDPCTNGTCKVNGPSFVCVCDKGFMGALCDQAVPVPVATPTGESSCASGSPSPPHSPAPLAVLFAALLALAARRRRTPGR